MKHFPIPLKYVDVMRQTQTSFNNVSQNIIIDFWTEAKGVTLFEEWTGITRFQIPRTRLLEGYKWVNGRPTKIPNTTRPDSLQNVSKKQGKSIAEWPEENAKLQAARRNRGIYEVLTDDKDYFQGDCRRSSETALALPCIEKNDSRGRDLRQL